MRFDTSQHMKLGQHMKLAPRMIQSMEILQMPLLQLEERIAQELESNVTLEVDEGDAQAESDRLADAAHEVDDLDGPSERSDSSDASDSTDDAESSADFAGDSEPTDLAQTTDERELNIDEAHGTDDFDRLEAFENENPEVRANEYTESGPEERTPDYDLLDRRAARLDGEPDAKSEAMANTPGRAGSLIEQLQEQWSLADVDETLRPLGSQIIAYIEDDGYLRTPLQTIVDRLPPPPAESPYPPMAQYERALTAIQLLLEPPGVGARDTRECLLLQIDAAVDLAFADTTKREGWAIVRRLVADHIDDLSQNRLPRIAEKTGLSMPDINAAIERMKHLTLAPGRQLVTEARSAIVPDAIVEYDADQDRYIAYLNDTRLPNLRINQEYAKIAKDRQAPAPTKEFIRKNLSNAAWLIDAVEQRRKTVLRVIRVVVDAQREYFDFGPQALRPLPMTQVAEQLGVHVATVSRAVADKYLRTPRGIVPLRGFFSGGTQTESGEEVSWDAVKAALKDIIDAEDKAAPLSDDALAESLSSRGIEIARRTVAKYRDQLNIPAARLRKQY